MFDCSDHCTRHMWVQDGDVLVAREKRQFSPKVHIYGAVGIGFRMLHVWPRYEAKGKRTETGNPVMYRVTGKRYRDYCLRRLIGASTHSAK